MPLRSPTPPRAARVTRMLVRGLAAVVSMAALPASANLTINPTYDSTITSLGTSAQIQSCLNSVCNLYNSYFSDPITVNITFRNTTSGLGSNSPTTITVSYATYRAALAADSSTANDTVALANLDNTTNNPVNGSANITLSRANARALGISAPVSVDDVINLNTGLCFLDHNTPQSGLYDLYAVACHEMDEALGSVSGVGGSPWSADLFRYDGSGNRSFAANTGAHAYLSLDKTTNIVEYNQFGRTAGDWGDWIHHTGAPQVQDWSGTSGQKIDLGYSETTLLDAVGYNYIGPVPEPATFAVMGMGVLALISRRKKKA